MRGFAKIVTALALVALPTVASATAVIGGNTRVAFGSLVSGLQVGLTGTATLVGSMEGLTVNFGITGGDLDDSLAGTIRHDGSGVTLSNGTNIVGLSNFVINTGTSFVEGDVSLNGTSLGSGLNLFTFNLGSVTLAELTNLSNPLLDLSITSTASGALDAAFGTGDTVGLQLGLAATAPELSTGAIPEPASWAMMIIGFGAVGTAMRRRQAAFGSVTA